MLRKISPFVLLIALLPFPSMSQDWVSKMLDPTVNFYDVQRSFNKYWEKEERREKLKNFFSLKPKTEKENEGYLWYKRWENYVEPRVYPSGDRSLLTRQGEEMARMINDHGLRNGRMVGGNWTPLGAFAVPTNYGGAGRLNCITFHPTDPNTIFVGAPDGGLWKTMDAGATWSTNTDYLPTLGVSDIAIDPSDPNTMYIGTGDIDAGDSKGVGVMKSTDGGATWNITGLNWLVINSRNVNRVLINPNDPNMIFAGTSNGVYRSLDAGATWTKTLSISNVRDMEFKPGDPSIVYACSSTLFYRSVNSGASFTVVPTSAGVPLTALVNRISIGVTPANPNCVYLLYSASSDSGFHGLYRSTNSGLNFTQQSNYPNLLGYDYDGNDPGGNGWYTLSLAVAPYDENEVMVGGVNVWKSQDGGQSWICMTHWWGDGGLPYIHADIHNLAYREDGSEFYAVNDGGIFKTTDGGYNWNDMSSGLQIGQMYRLGNSVTNPNLVIQGWQDNGCNLYNTGAFNRVIGGDGMECFIDWSSTTYMYGEYQNGALLGSTDGGATFNDIYNNITEPGQWVTPWCQDPVVSTTIYAGFSNVWKSTNRGNFWTQISTFSSGGLTILEVAKSNPQYIYAATSGQIWRTTTGGGTWTTIPYPFSGGDAITALEVSETDPNKIWITRSGYTAANKVHQSIDGGATWTNLSGGLPNIPVNCVVSQTGTANGIYVGTDLGVYYYDDSLATWMPYSNGLPNVVVTEMEIHYPTNKLRAATFGRGLWESEIRDPLSNLPFANFAGDTLSGCPGFNVQFTDSTANSPTAWAWTFPGGTPSTSNLQNPVVTYNTPGVYQNVTLVVTNAFGVDSITKFSYISVSPATIPTISLNKNDTICSGTTVQLSASNGASYLWSTGQTSQLINVNATDTIAVRVTDVFGCSGLSDTVIITVVPAIPVPTITYSNDTLFSSSSFGNQWYNNGVAIPGATNTFYDLPAPALTITLTVTDSFGICSATSTPWVGINEAGENGISYSVFPNPGDGMISLVMQTDHADEISVAISDALGRKVYEKTYSSFHGRMEEKIDLTRKGKGVYILSLMNSKGLATKKLVVR